ncbi:MAG: oxygen-independent coproporphyrinogen III oxidase [Gammaproteobacteria bacterium]|nr:oxygen-independent coproporphyrinogen III oxidase [Gammaproteobacteria bacterium]NIR83456.1 oxygen-independent coproporphyrinogen III oxidase [Gammaproteobacteria bacterium]NIR91378.1 oxygen-independent coproporphyrinogen III oxidase [Gammaproteobacteria bacterium]NIU04618.1 oxygen-independent coproporphyrinogen III oxidase [Gammaproteobacteria bacterium]NIV51660.1 oxygen-independent coproporphyrinogen III oxidase [Gammaproteobacteria bacterium]
MNGSPLFNARLIRRYDKAGPRYTSYPTAAQFHEHFAEAEYGARARRSNEDLIPPPLSLYFHIPFCDTVCYYCACNKIVTKNRTRALPYLASLHREIALQGALFARDRVVEQLHWGGGTPTFLSRDQMRELTRVTREHFTLRDDDRGEYSVEIDPRRADDLTVAVLRDLGFNRMSMGVQDFDPAVQRAVNRIQSEAETRRVIQAARREGFKSINVDLIYGLPRQTPASFARTLDKIIDIDPDRLSVFNYAHLPQLFKTQRQINEAELPAPAAKLEILALTIEHLTNAGYVYIGMDHFAKPDDELAAAQRNGTLHRNFQGFSSHAECDLVAMGVSAISKVRDCYAQNTRDLEAYCRLVDTGHIPVFRGIELDTDDRLRRHVISEMICHGHLDVRAVERQQGVRFASYFAEELADLQQMVRDGLVAITDDAIDVLPPGRLLIRNICMVFDRYLREAEHRQRFSRVI